MNSKIEKIKKIAEDVYKTLGSGFSEDVYDKAMQVGLRIAKIRYESQKVIELKYKDHCVGEGYPDLVVNLDGGKVVVELKAVEKVLPVHKKQLLTYLRLTGKKLGMLVNFNVDLIKDGIERVVNGL